MKYIVSTIGSPIEFMLNKDRKFTFDPIIPTEVSEAEYIILKKRLGVQLKDVPQSTPLEKEAEPDDIDEEM